MHALRRLIARRRGLMAVLLALALAMKLLIPAGYMLEGSGRQITVTLCSGTGPMQMAMPMKGDMPHKSDAKADMPCAFAGLGMASLSAVDPILLALAILFIVATMFRAALPAPTAPPAYLRPPLRGPPATF